MTDDATARRRMVRHQVRGRGVRDPRLLEAMERVPRERFVPEAERPHAFEDRPIPVADGVVLPQAHLTACRIEPLALAPGARVLLAGLGTGYAAAVLAEMGAEVFAIEPDGPTAERAAALLADLGHERVHVRHEADPRAWEAEGPFDAILLRDAVDTPPPELFHQLARGGHMVATLGRDRPARELVRYSADARGRLDREDLADLRFVPPLDAEQGAARAGPAPARVIERRPRRSAALPDLILRHAETFDAVESADLDPLIARIGDRRVVLIGEASHGTSEFYALRARITRRLIAEKGFTIVAAEADWPDAARIDAYVRHRDVPPREWEAFARFPHWMWHNAEVRDFANWLHHHNKAQQPADRAGFYGLDLYSLFASTRAILDYLDDTDPELAALARERYGCLSPFEADPAAYGRAAITGAYRDCEEEVTRMLADLVRRRAEGAPDGQRFLDAQQNAALVANAERYYRIMYYGSRASWNLRDRHMFETLLNVMEFHGDGAKAVVWAHNSHVGDARATEMGRRGERNLGEMCAQGFGAGSCRIGMGTDSGTVAAASDWGGPMEIKQVRPAHPQSYERQFHLTGARGLILPMRPGHELDVATELAEPRLERAIGVIYRPESELASHYFEAELPRQFDEYIWIDRTRAVTPLHARREPGLPDTYPFGL